MSYWRVILKGSLGTVETWSTSVAYGIVGIATDTPDQTMTDAIATAVEAAITSSLVGPALDTLLSTAGTIDIIRIEKRAEDETVLNVSEQLLAPSVAGSGSPSKTPQDAVVFSLRTSTPGARGRGRMYWPALGALLSSTFQLASPAQVNVAGDVKALLQAINTAIDGVYLSIGAAQRAALSVRSVTDHVCRDVTSIQIGSVLDTQRRRRDSLPETYVAVAYP
jgi:hypothetical protein